jgi:hypothetical protein
MAVKKKPAAKKKAPNKTTKFVPKIKSTKRDGLGSYESSR